MSRWHNYYIDRHAHFCTATVLDWKPFLDESGVQVLWEEWEIARQALEVKILAYCVMPEHFHVVLWAESGQSIKRFLHRTLAQVSRRLKPGGGFWKERPHVLPVHSRTVIDAKVDYMHYNPLRRKLVENPEQWPYSSFRQLMLGVRDTELECDGWDMVPL